MTDRRIRPRHLLLVSVILASVLAAVAAIVHRRTPEPAALAAPSSFEPGALQVDPASRFLVVGGGGDPDSSAVQLEHEAILARSTFRGPGTTLFAGGAGRFGVSEDRPRGEPTFREAVGALFLPRVRAGRVRPPSFVPDGAATYENVTGALERTLAAGTDPLVVVVATHGMAGDDGLDGYALLWGNDGLFADELSAIVGDAGHMRPSRFVVGSCHGGAFAPSLASADLDASGNARTCGFFATDAGRLASGCDGDPDRAHHRSYLRSFLAALRDRRADTSGDGRVSMLEAHVAAASSLESFDVPLTTSESVIREAGEGLLVAERAGVDLHDDDVVSAPAPVVAPSEAVAESSSVARALSTRLGLADELAAQEALEEIRGRMDEMDESLAELESSRDTAWNRLRVAALERFPWLEDAYAPGWEAKLEAERASIEPLLMRSELAEALALLEEQVETTAAALDDLRVREAMITRLVLALEFPRMLGAVRASAPDIAARYDALRTCERFVPELAP